MTLYCRLSLGQGRTRTGRVSALDNRRCFLLGLKRKDRATAKHADEAQQLGPSIVSDESDVFGTKKPTTNPGIPPI